VYIIIVGAGEVGTYLARMLVSEEHDVALIEREESIVRGLDASLDALVIRGSGIDRDCLASAGINKADLVLAVTAIDEVNLITCMVASRLAPDVRTVARVRGIEYLVSRAGLTADSLGLSKLVGPERAIASKVVSLLQYEGAGEMRKVAGGKLVLLELPLGPDSPFVHETLSELTEVLGDKSLVCAVLGDHGVRIPRGSDKLQVDERAMILTTPDSVDMFMILSGKPWHHVHHVLIIGCGTIGFHLAQELEAMRVYPTIIEMDAARAEFVAQRLDKCEVLHGDGTDTELLTEELAERADAVVVLLEDDEKAMLLGLFAKHLGAKKVIVRSDKPAYWPIGRKLGIDALISPQRALADAILRYVHRGEFESAHIIGSQEGEMIQLKVSNAKIIGKPLKEIDFPIGSLIGAVIRDGEVDIARGHTVLQAGDDVLVVALPAAVQKVEKLLT